MIEVNGIHNVTQLQLFRWFSWQYTLILIRMDSIQCEVMPIFTYSSDDLSYKHVATVMKQTNHNEIYHMGLQAI